MKTDPLFIKSTVPEGDSGNWHVERFVVAEDPDYDVARDSRPEFAKRLSGTYTLLRRGSENFMTDLYDEWWTQQRPIQEARNHGGNILITGLGLGMIVESILKSPVDTSIRITVVEFSNDVIKLVAPHLQARYGSRLNIIHGDAFDWSPPANTRYTVGWHDIWSNPVSVKVASQMELLEQRFRDCCDWQGCWPRDYAQAYQEHPAGS